MAALLPISESQGSAHLLNPELAAFIEIFLNNVDYDAMTDFFLTFRAHLTCEALLAILRDKWHESETIIGLSSHNAKVRIFVALRHWILNYYCDDFMLTEEIQQSMSQFLNEMGGFGADEITTEARIAKELRKTWTRENETYSLTNPEQIQPAVDEVSHKRALLGLSEILPRGCQRISTSSKPGCVTVYRQQSVKRVLRKMRRTLYNGRRSMPLISKSDSEAPTKAAPEDASLVDTGPEDVEHVSCDSEVDSRKSRCSIPRKSSNIIIDFEDLQRQLRGSIVAYPPQSQEPAMSGMPLVSLPTRQLRRKPGGILKNAQAQQQEIIIADVPSPTSSTMSSYGEDLPAEHSRWQNLRASLPERKPGQPVESATDEFLKRLIEMFENESSDSDEDTPSVARQKALDRLEGRTGSEKKRKSSFDLQKNGPCQSDEELDEDEDSDYPKTSVWGSEKRRRRVGIVPRLDDADITFETPVKIYNPPDGKHVTTESKEDLTVVSMVEALGIPSAQSTKRTGDSCRRIDIEETYTSWLLLHNTAHVAQALSKIENLTLLELDWLELTSGVWINSSTQVLSLTDWRHVISQNVVGISLILARFNCAVAWITSEITNSDTTESKTAIIAKFVEIAILCRSYNNFTTVMQIVQALKSPPVKRLPKVWSRLPRSTIRQWKAIESLCDKRGNWRLLSLTQDRAMINPESTVVPFLGIYLSRLLAIEQSSDSIITKSRGTATITRSLLSMLDRINVANGDSASDEHVDDALLSKLVWISDTRPRPTPPIPAYL